MSWLLGLGLVELACEVGVASSELLRFSPLPRQTCRPFPVLKRCHTCEVLSMSCDLQQRNDYSTTALGQSYPYSLGSVVSFLSATCLYSTSMFLSFHKYDIFSVPPARILGMYLPIPAWWSGGCESTSAYAVLKPHALRSKRLF